MTDRCYIRVTKSGSVTIRELVVDRMKICELSYTEVCDIIDQLTQAVRLGRGANYALAVHGADYPLSFVEALEMIMQATSSLRW